MTSEKLTKAQMRALECLADDRDPYRFRAAFNNRVCGALERMGLATFEKRGFVAAWHITPAGRTALSLKGG